MMWLRLKTQISDKLDSIEASPGFELNLLGPVIEKIKLVCTISGVEEDGTLLKQRVVELLEKPRLEIMTAMQNGVMFLCICCRMRCCLELSC